MKPVKRLEIVIEALAEERVVELLRRHDLTGWTIVHDVSGSGSRGERRSDEPTDLYRNSLIVVACDEPVLVPLTEALRPLLARWGGVCLVSDAGWLTH